MSLLTAGPLGVVRFSSVCAIPTEREPRNAARRYAQGRVAARSAAPKCPGAHTARDCRTAGSQRPRRLAGGSARRRPHGGFGMRVCVSTAVARQKAPTSPLAHCAATPASARGRPSTVGLASESSRRFTAGPPSMRVCIRVPAHGARQALGAATTERGDGRKVFGSRSAALRAAGVEPYEAGASRELPREIRRRYEAGESTNQLARAFGCSTNAISRSVRAAGGTMRSRPEAQTVRRERARAATE